MARATRSSTQHQEKEREKQSDSPALSSRLKVISKKRKRASVSNDEDQPSPKQLRTDWDLKIETSSEPDQPLSKENLTPQLPYAGEVPIDPTDSQKILDVLEMIDTQGLLDRVFPLPAGSSQSQSKSYSLRTLLKDSAHHPLSVLRSAIHNLLPISSHPRSRPSAPAAQQLRFCNLALSLLDQASFHSVPIPLDLETILPSPPESGTSADINGVTKLSHTSAESPTSSPVRNRKFALMQRLPSCDWWTSLNSDSVLPALSTRDLKNFHTAHSELVSILPSPSMPPRKDVTSDSSTKALPSTPTLGSYTSKKASGQKPKLPSPRRVSCGTFLDYGPYTSFAPVFDQDGAEIGRSTLGEVIWEMEERNKRKNKQNANAVFPISAEDPDDVIMSNNAHELLENESSTSTRGEKIKEEVEHSLNGLFPPDQVAMIKSALGNLELESAVHELLERNKKGLVRLEELQLLRLSGKGGGSSQVEEGSEEWDTAQEIMKTLVVLASLRPRLSGDNSDTSPFVPPPAILHKLHRTLPLDSSRGWYGTLPSIRSTALRDDSTLRVRSGATTLPTTAVNPTPATPMATATPASGTTPAAVYPGFPYTGYAAYRGGFSSYKPVQTPAFYSAAYPSHTPHTPGQAQTGTQTYYPGQGYTATGQQQYSYGSWFNYQPQTGAGTSSGRGTPQPGGGAAAAAVNYAGFFNNTQQPPAAGQRAVANTAVAVKPYTPGAAVAAVGGGPTLPSYPRVSTSSLPPGPYQPPSYIPPYPQTTPSAAQ